MTEITYDAIREYAEFVGLDPHELAASLGVTIPVAKSVASNLYASNPQHLIEKALGLVVAQSGLPIEIGSEYRIETFSYEYRFEIQRPTGIHVMRYAITRRMMESMSPVQLGHILIEQLRGFIAKFQANKVAA